MPFASSQKLNDGTENIMPGMNINIEPTRKTGIEPTRKKEVTFADPIEVYGNENGNENGKENDEYVEFEPSVRMGQSKKEKRDSYIPYFIAFVVLLLLVIFAFDSFTARRQ